MIQYKTHSCLNGRWVIVIIILEVLTVFCYLCVQEMPTDQVLIASQVGSGDKVSLIARSKSKSTVSEVN